MRHKKSPVAKIGAWTHGGIPDPHRQHAHQTLVEIWIASTARAETYIEVVAVFARATQVGR